MNKLVCLAVVVAAVVWNCNSVDALKCYDCNSGIAGCDDPFETATETNGCTMCMKAKNDAGLMRSCFSEAGAQVGCSDVTADGTTSEVCYCDTDLCNGASSVYVTSGLITAAVVIAVKLLL